MNKTSPNVLKRIRDIENKLRVVSDAVNYLMESKNYIPKEVGENAYRNTLYLQSKIDELKDLIEEYEAR